ncbi:hypothetical protein [Clostridiisalibacter paucivorans]|uniref:hypothetical protein n=1 Tax=Clostridiisalibacter paucivorans TaxID=408753 RepID=UPI00047D825D|nr:hypothetical protein [Clostridiisalibacter paucivorans]
MYNTELHKLEVEIKQHTPMIHFQQHCEENATLRMTELKPKLDRFIHQKFFKKKDIKDYGKYLIGYNNSTEYKYGDVRPFNYRVKVQNIEKIRNKQLKIGESFPLFFANMGKNNEDKYGFVFSNNLKLVFISFYEDIIDNIIEVLPEFFMKNNFGTRQSKGFGSFFINSNNDYKLNGARGKFKDVDKVKKLKYHFSIPNENTKNQDIWDKYKEVFGNIDKFYSYLRSGLRRNIIDPLIKEYSISKKIRWDKDEIKNKLFSEKSWNDDLEPKLMKDLFGLSTSEIWEGQLIEKKDKGKEIERFQSPIFFKILDEEDKFVVHFEAKEIPKRYLDQEFIISKKGEEGFKLKTPEEFDFDDFFHFAFNREEYPGEVKAIFEDIKRNMEG